MTEKAKSVLDDLVLKITSANTLGFIHKRLFTDDIDIPCKKWSLMNQFILFTADTYDARGMRQWAKAGRKLIKGSHAIYILAPVFSKKKNKTDNDKKDEKEERDLYNEAPHDDKKDTDGNDDDDEAPQKILVGFKAFPVFKVEDTTGRPLDYEIKLKAYDVQALPLIEVAENLGIKVEARLINHYGSYNLTKNRISMGHDDAQTFLHELSHAVDFALPHFNNNRNMNEIVAELSSAFLGSLYGVEIDMHNTIAYIQGYSGKANIITNVMKAIQRVEEIYTYIKDSAPHSKENRLFSA
jgi:antirestriction protein ArdC